jgi:hypothetical protein
MSAQVEAEADPLEPEMKARYPDQSSIQPTQRDCDRLSRSLTITSASTAASSAPPEREASGSWRRWPCPRQRVERS